MTAKGLADYIRFKLKKDSTTLTDAELLPIINMWMQQMAQRIIGVNEDLFGVVATTDLVADQRQYQDPDDIVKMKYLEAKFDGTNWIKLSEFDLDKYQLPTDEATILANFSNSEGCCFFDRFGSSFYIYSGEIDDVTDGLRLHYISYPGVLTGLTDDTTDLSVAPDSTHCGFPREFQELLARRVVIDIKSSGDTPKALSEREQLFVFDFDSKVDELAGLNLDRVFTASLPDDGSDDGFNY